MSEHREALLAGELLALVNDQAELTKAKLNGQLQWIQLSGPDHKIKPETWVLKAQLGTIEKFQQIIKLVGLEQDVFVIAIARNAFENLIWLKLFNQDKYYGLVFYRQLLQQQLDSQMQAIAKAREEVELFKQLESEDEPDFDSIVDLVDENTTRDERLAIISNCVKACAEKIDLKARSAFSIYAQQAKRNGYAYQAHLIESDAIPHHEARIKILNEHMAELLRSMPADINPLIEPEFLEKAPRWNWADRASKLGMASQYKFLYAFTSRLLHATPLSLVTPAELSSQEKCLLLDYLCLSVKASYEEISKFKYAGQVNVVGFSFDGVQK
ncbi:hypothetical protein [Pseudomonas moraviensis]|uniref:hypothetical protein n=1 Tax=Pseudomonas moraviensis TaxID=321662 RepID=UPI0022C4890D|nr:hypothetical protein [Pseudomonas moraviensis]GLH39105.1 hypothetical protein RS1P1_33890 [Pseudomonas moraviensis]